MADMAHDRDLPLGERLAGWVAHLAHVLPAQAPIRDFVHHNTLHGFQHLPFAEAVAAAHRLTGARAYWPESRFHAALAEGRVDAGDLAAALDDAGLADLDRPLAAGVSRRAVLLASLQLDLTPPVGARRDWQQRERGADPDFGHFLALTADADPDVAADWQTLAAARWQVLCDRVGRQWSLRSLLEYLSEEDVLARVRSILQRHLAAHLDLGVAAWRNPDRALGFFAAWRASAGLDLQWELDELPNVRDEIIHLPGDPLAVLGEELARLMPDETLWYGYLERLALELPGWSGMFLWRASNPDRGDGTPVAMADYLAVRVLLERLLCEDLLRRMTGLPMSFDELQGYYLASLGEFHVRDALRQGVLPEALQDEAAALLTAGPGHDAAWASLAGRVAAATGTARWQDAWRLQQLARALALPVDHLQSAGPAAARELLDCALGLDNLQRGEIWLLAYERHYREQLFSALAANRGRVSAKGQPSAQVVFCMDDREEGTRRHLEEIAPAVETYGAAGFFGVAMFWQGIDDATKTALCPVVVQPRHLVAERVADADLAALAGHRQRRERRLQWRERLYQSTRRSALLAPVLSAAAAVPALMNLAANQLAPAWQGAAAQRWRRQHDGDLRTILALTADAAENASVDAPQGGFTDDEQVERVAGFLRTIGLAGGFAPVVLMFGHGSGSRNNPHLSAYDCGACSGRHGGPNARVFAAMANRPEVRAGLAQRGLHIPESTWFIAAEHNTCDDGVEWYDLEQAPPAFAGDIERLLTQVGEACRAHAAERCRRLASAPVRPSPWLGKRHVQGRANDISQARPELGHATNAAAFIGRRSMSRGLFLDRRVFLISYDPTQDPGGSIVENILLAAGPVGAGIALEYYFSTVDNERYGCGSKITHNLSGLFGVMEGADSDLRTGLPWQMVEIHEPMRLLVVVEQETDCLSAIVSRQPALQELVGKGWITVAAQSPSTGEIQRYCPRRGWLAWSGTTVLPQVARSADWFAGESAPLPPAMLLGGRA